MELEKDSEIFETIHKYLSFNMNEDNELEIVFYRTHGSFTEVELKNFTSVFKSMGYEENIEDENLRVSSENISINISPMQNIVKYFNSNIHNQNTTFTRSTIVMSDIIDNVFDINMKFVLREKKQISAPDVWDDMKKSFVLEKNILYTRENTQYKARMYKDTENEFYSFKQSNTIKMQQMYEFSIVLKSVQNISEDDIIQTIIRTIQSISMSSMILTIKQQNDIKNEYYQMVKDDIEISAYNLKDKSFIPLLAPKPVTLELVNLKDPKTYGIVSILSEYTVTEKADGERVLMYVNGEGKVYLINNTLNVEYTGLVVSSKEGWNSLIDGEYIQCHKRKDDADKGLYAAFDMYYIGGKLITSLPLMDKSESRYLNLQKFEKLISGKSMNFIVKEHKYSDNILKDSNYILTNHKEYPYEIDGLIFTPAKLAVYSYYTNYPVQITDNVKWDRVFKWKPVEQNTIDFLIKFTKTVKKNGIVFQEVGLYVGYNPLQWEDIDIITGLKRRYDAKSIKTPKTSNKYIPVLFQPKIYYVSGMERAHIKINRYHNREIRAENGDKIETDSIVEFKYINDDKIPINERWVPIRTREDKTRLYRKNILGKTLNELSVAMNIWRSIHNPVTTTMIKGNDSLEHDTGVDRTLDSDDVYYSRNIPRHNMLSYHMANFHNHGIKELLYNKPKHKNSLLELCCGEAGDMSRWLSNGYKFVLGVDFVIRNIVNPKSGCYSRMMKARYKHMNEKQNAHHEYFPDYVFAAGDCALSLKSGKAANNDKIKHPDSEMVLKTVLNPSRHTHEKYIRRIEGKGVSNSNGLPNFDAVSCMFAVHYFFENEEKLDGFLDNVSENLKPGGVFFCTFMNGDKIEKEIKEDGDMIEGKKLQSEYVNGMPVWAIIRRYNKNHISPYGKKVDVFIENTQKFISESLVSYSTLVEKAKQHKLILKESQMFEETFNQLKEQLMDKNDENKDSVLLNSISNLDQDDVQKKFSFFNQWAVFEKMSE